MIIPHKANITEVDFYRRSLTRSEYVEELIKRSFPVESFKYKGETIAYAGVLSDPHRGVRNYWQILTNKFPDDYIPQVFIKDFVHFGDSCLAKYNSVIVCIFDENRFAKWLLHYGKKQSKWKVAVLAKEKEPDRSVYKIDRGD